MSLLIINLVIGFSIPRIDWRAHIGGFVAGLVAGHVVDPSRPPAIRRIVAVTGLVGLLLAAAALVGLDLRSSAPIHPSSSLLTRPLLGGLTPRRPQAAASSLPRSFSP